MGRREYNRCKRFLYGALYQRPMPAGPKGDETGEKNGGIVIAENIYDIARQSGVSIATVSRVINGKGNVSEKTRQRVLSVMEEAGYRPNIFARGLGLHSIRMVGVMCSDVADIFYAQAVSCLENELRGLGYDAILCCTGDDLAHKQKGIELLLSKHVDAIILVGSVFKELHDNSHIERAAAQIPVVIINGRFELPGAYCVLCDDRRAMAANVQALAKAGRRDILYLYDSESFSGISKLAGYQDGLREAGIAYRDELVVQCGKGLEQAREAVLGVLGQGRRFDGLAAAEDLLAVGALQALREQGIPVPGEVGVIGFNDSILARCAFPPLSSVDNKVGALCETAVRVLMGVFAGKNVPQQTVLTADLVRRESF